MLGCIASQKENLLGSGRLRGEWIGRDGAVFPVVAKLRERLFEEQSGRPAKCAGVGFVIAVWGGDDEQSIIHWAYVGGVKYKQEPRNFRRAAHCLDSDFSVGCFKDVWLARI